MFSWSKAAFCGFLFAFLVKIGFVLETEKNFLTGMQNFFRHRGKRAF
jgi:hypothetical protein